MQETPVPNSAGFWILLPPLRSLSDPWFSADPITYISSFVVCPIRAKESADILLVWLRGLFTDLNKNLLFHYPEILLKFKILLIKGSINQKNSLNFRLSKYFVILLTWRFPIKKIW